MITFTDTYRSSNDESSVKLNYVSYLSLPNNYVCKIYKKDRQIDHCWMLDSSNNQVLFRNIWRIFLSWFSSKLIIAPCILHDTPQKFISDVPTSQIVFFFCQYNGAENFVTWGPTLFEFFKIFFTTLWKINLLWLLSSWKISCLFIYLLWIVTAEYWFKKILETST